MRYMKSLVVALPLMASTALFGQGLPEGQPAELSQMLAGVQKIIGCRVAPLQGKRDGDGHSDELGLRLARSWNVAEPVNELVRFYELQGLATFDAAYSYMSGAQLWPRSLKASPATKGLSAPTSIRATDKRARSRCVFVTVVLGLDREGRARFASVHWQNPNETGPSMAALGQTLSLVDGQWEIGPTSGPRIPCSFPGLRQPLRNGNLAGDPILIARGVRGEVATQLCGYTYFTKGEFGSAKTASDLFLQDGMAAYPVASGVFFRARGAKMPKIDEDRLPTMRKGRPISTGDGDTLAAGLRALFGPEQTLAGIIGGSPGSDNPNLKKFLSQVAANMKMELDPSTVQSGQDSKAVAPGTPMAYATFGARDGQGRKTSWLLIESRPGGSFLSGSFHARSSLTLHSLNGSAAAPNPRARVQRVPMLPFLDMGLSSGLRMRIRPSIHTAWRWRDAIPPMGSQETTQSMIEVWIGPGMANARVNPPKPGGGYTNNSPSGVIDANTGKPVAQPLVVAGASGPPPNGGYWYPGSGLPLQANSGNDNALSGSSGGDPWGPFGQPLDFHWQSPFTTYWDHGTNYLETPGGSTHVLFQFQLLPAEDVHMPFIYEEDPPFSPIKWYSK